jgi:predicted ABC-type ATPase
MPTIYVIAGPPGIGKSTNGRAFVPNDIPVENSDLLANYLKSKGEVDYQEIAFDKIIAKSKKNCLLGIDFGVEINLGYQIPHYSIVRFLKEKFNYRVEVILFFTDSLRLCLNRTFERELSGGHRVPERIVREMYANTIPLLHKNIALIDHLQFVNVTESLLSPELVYSGYYPEQTCEFVQDNLPNWVRDNFTQYLFVNP